MWEVWLKQLVAGSLYTYGMNIGYSCRTKEVTILHASACAIRLLLIFTKWDDWSAIKEFQAFISNETQALSIEFKDNVVNPVPLDMDEIVMQVKVAVKK